MYICQYSLFAFILTGGLLQNNKQIFSLSLSFLSALTSLHQSCDATALKMREYARSTCARTHARTSLSQTNKKKTKKTNCELLAPPPQHDLINGRARSVDKVRLC